MATSTPTPPPGLTPSHLVHFKQLEDGHLEATVDRMGRLTVRLGKSNIVLHVAIPKRDGEFPMLVTLEQKEKSTTYHIGRTKKSKMPVFHPVPVEKGKDEEPSETES